MKTSATTRGAFAGRLLRLISSAMIVAGFAALAYVGYVIVNARHFQQTEAAKFSMPQKAEAMWSVPKVGQRLPVADGDVLGMIKIPSIGVRAVIVQGDSSALLRRAVGHVPGTPLPGEPGNVALAAHRDTIFRPLRNIKAGDRIDLITASGVIQYRVRSTEIVRPSDTGVLSSHGRNELTLVTCYPFYYVGHAPDRFIVRAGQVMDSPR
jgi:sortase A